MRKATIFIVVAFMLVLCGTPVLANGIPPLPHAFYGDVTINGSPAPAGTTVEARGAGVQTSIKDNPITTTESGKFGKAGALEPKLIVQGDILDGAIITFYVNGHSTGQTAEWHSGETTELNLSATISGGGGPGGGGPGGGAGPTIDITIDGQTTTYDISDEGEILETVNVTSADGNLNVNIPEGTIALDEDGNPLTGLTFTVDETPPDPPEGANILGLPYNLGPNGATFNPPITLTWEYDPADIPDGVDEEDLVLAYYDEDASEWVELDCTVDPDTHTITASVSHFTTFAIIGSVAPPPPTPAAFTPSSLVISPAEVDIGETVTISISVANTGGQAGSHTVTLKIDGVVEETKEITVAAGANETATFTIAKDKVGTYSVDVNGLIGSFMVKEAPAPTAPPAPAPSPTPPSKVNWLILGPVLGVAVFLAIFLPIRLRRRRTG